MNLSIFYVEIEPVTRENTMYAAKASLTVCQKYIKTTYFREENLTYIKKHVIKHIISLYSLVYSKKGRTFVL